jgi:hypothetical protein
MKNPYQELHQEFVQAGARVLLSSGQACVMYGIAVEQDQKIQEDGIRINKMMEASGDFQEKFFHLKKGWKEKQISLSQQHLQLREAAEQYLLSV